MTTPDGSLPEARRHLADAIRALIDPQRTTITPGRHTWLDSTYQQLAEAVYHKHALGGGRHQAAAPLWIDASDCLRDIDHTVRVEHPQHPGYAPHDHAEAAVMAHPTVLRLQQIDKRTWRPQDTRHIQEFTANLERLTSKADRLLNPPTSWYLPNPCPLCGNTHIYTDDAGDQIRRPALHLTTEYCRCGNQECKGFWNASKFAFLGKLLGNPPIAGVIGS